MEGGGGFAASLSKIAVASIALGVTVMILAVSILRGFQHDIGDKVSGFGSHIVITSYNQVADYEQHPIQADSALIASLRAVPGVRHVQPFATKGGMVKTDEQIQGIILRGLDASCDTSFFSNYLVEGHLPNLSSTTTASNEVLVSTTIARKLGLSVGDKMRTYFWQDRSYRSRAFTVCGLYNTDLTEMDELYAVGDLRQVQRLSAWDSAEVGGLELLVDDFDQLGPTAARVAQVLPYDLRMTTVVAQNPALFSWLDLLNSNITLILIIMGVVCAIAVVSALLIMIFEQRPSIGILKTLGASNASVRLIFMLKAGRLIAAGVLAGTALSLLLGWLQRQFHIVQLDPESYSMSVVPVELSAPTVVIIGLATAAACTLALLLPASVIAHIDPAKNVSQ